MTTRERRHGRSRHRISIIKTYQRYLAGDMQIGLRLGLGMLALASCAGSRPQGSLPERTAQGADLLDASTVPTSRIDVTSQWDAQSPSSVHETPPAEGPLVSLTAQWGAKGELPLRELDAKVIIEGPLAFTELHLVFENTTDHLIEANEAKLVVPSWARFDLRLPVGGALTRYAVEQADGWKEAEMAAVSRDHPCSHTSWAPKALPEVTAETPRRRSHFAANIEPIKPHSRKTVLVAFTQPLVSPAEPYRLSLSGLARLDRFDAVARFPLSGNGATFTVHKEAWTPDGDWVVEPPPVGAHEPRTKAPQPDALRSGRFAVARIARPLVAADSEPIHHVAFLLDTSTSRGEGMYADAKLLASLVRPLATATPDASIHVAAFDQDVEPIYSGPAGAFAPPELARLEARSALGATDLGRALRWAAQQHPDRVVVLSDGVPTLGARTAADLAQDLDSLRSAGVKRLDATTSSDEAGEALLTTLAAGLERRGAMFGRDETSDVIGARLTHATTEPIDVPGAIWSWPKEMRAGASVLVFAELAPGKQFEVKVSGTTVPLDVRDAKSPLVAHEAARADVERLESALAEDASATDPARAVLAKLSKEYRVLSQESRWVVPSSEQHYAELGIDRVTSPILSAGPAGVEAPIREPLHLLPAKRSECRPGPLPKGGGYFNDLVGRTRSTPTRVLLERGPGEYSVRDPSAVRDDLYRAMFKQNPPRGSLEVEGYCNESSLEAVNMRISRARARAFRDGLFREPLLHLWGDVQARGYGSTPPLVGYYEYAWGDGWGPGRGANKPAIGDPPRGEVAVRVVVREPPKAPTLASSPFGGRLDQVLSASNKQEALDVAQAWHRQASSDPVSSLAVGLTGQALGSHALAARAFGSLLDLEPFSASARRSAAALLERNAPDLSLQLLQEATGLEPDQRMMSQWALGLALARRGRLDDAADTLASTLEAWLGIRSLANGDMKDFRELERIFFPSPSTLDVLEQELSVLAAAAARAHPEKKASLEARLRPYGVPLATKPSLRFVLTWESNTDLDLQVERGKSGWDPRASIDRDALPGEGIVLADVRAFGPEAYVVDGAVRAFPYRVLAHLHGPAGATLGRVDILDYDGVGHLGIEEHPFVIQTEGGTVEVTTLRGPVATR
jgi:hypothetical protein